MKKGLILALALLLMLATVGCARITSLLRCFPWASDIFSVPVSDVTETETTAPEPVEEPTPVPTEEPTPEPTEEPTPEPTEAPKAEAALLGGWSLKTMESEGQSYDAAAFGIEISFVFLENGTVDVTAYGETANEPYTVAGNAVTIIEADGNIEGVYDPETDMIVFEKNDVKITLVRTGSEPAAAAPQTSAPEPHVASAEDMVGTWTLTRANVNGIEVPGSMIGQSMEFVFNEDGSASMRSDEDAYDGLSWSFADNMLKLGAYGTDLYDLMFDGTALTLHESASGVDLIFEKN